MKGTTWPIYEYVFFGLTRWRGGSIRLMSLLIVTRLPSRTTARSGRADASPRPVTTTLGHNTAAGCTTASSLTSADKDPELADYKLLVVQPLDLDDVPRLLDDVRAGALRDRPVTVLGFARFSNFALFDSEAIARDWLERGDAPARDLGVERVGQRPGEVGDPGELGSESHGIRGSLGSLDANDDAGHGGSSCRV